MVEVPERVRTYIDAVVDRVAVVFGADLVGVYTTGSLALDGFQPSRSDIDLMAVVDGSGDRHARQQLAERLDHRVLPCPAAGLEFVLYPRATVAGGRLDAAYLLNLNTGSGLPPVISLDPGDGPAFWYVIDRAVTFQSGEALLGLPVKDVFEPLSFEQLLPAVIESVAEHTDLGAGHLLDNAVLNGCRAVRFAEDRRWYTKLEAGRRTLPTAGEFAPLIRESMATFLQGRRMRGQLAADSVQAFLAQTFTNLRTARA